MDDSNIIPPDEITLHRMIWHPDCYDEGELTSSGAFRSNDLKGDNFVSVDRSDLFDIEVVKTRARAQQEKANGETTFREEARVIDLHCGAVREIEDAQKLKPLAVTSEKERDNPAHCGIRNVSGNTGKPYINRLRAKLMALRSNEWKIDL
ncbi:MAG: hypothetical protein ABJL67_12570 [Sulfitobacter sp.]